MVSKYFNVNLRMPNYWSSGILRKTGNNILIYLNPDVIYGKGNQKGEYLFTLYNTTFNEECSVSTKIVEFVASLFKKGEIMYPYKTANFNIDGEDCSLEFVSEIDDFEEQLELEEKYLKNIPKY